jgi:hypothetical protein
MANTDNSYYRFAIRQQWSYFKYVMRHKWFVLVAGVSLKVPVIQLLLHDWTKFLPSLWLAYANAFYAKNGSSRYCNHFLQYAWNWHQKIEKHHWQAWMLQEDGGESVVLPMPVKFVYEMIADWMGAGMAIKGHKKEQAYTETKIWYEANKEKIKLHPWTRASVECVLRTF